MRTKSRVIRTVKRVARCVIALIACTSSSRQIPTVASSFSSTFPYTPPPSNTTTSRQHEHTTHSNRQPSCPPFLSAFHLIPQPRAPPMTSPSGKDTVSCMPQCSMLIDAAETWDDDFEFQSNHSSRSSKTKKQKGASSSAVPPRPSEEESWDDAYEDEDMARRAVGQRRDTDEDMGSWGSGSEWSGDGDAEDLSHDSYTGVTSEPPERRSSSSASQAEHPNPRTPGLSHPHVPPLSNATLTPTSTPLTTSASFFSKISPVKKWRARDADLTPKASGTERTKPRMAGPEKKPRRLAQKPASTMTPNQDSEAHVYATGTHPKATSELKYGVSGANPPLITSLSGQSSQMETQPSTLPSLHHVPPLTPDLTFSPTSINSSILSPSLPPVSAGPGSTAKAALPSVSLPVSRSNRHVRPSTAIPSLSPAPSLPLLSSSAHNLPLSAPPTHTSTLILTPRRSSLSDLKRPQLKIPERISRVQQDIKRDMGDVKGFADCVARESCLQCQISLLFEDLLLLGAPSTWALWLSAVIYFVYHRVGRLARWVASLTSDLILWILGKTLTLLCWLLVLVLNSGGLGVLFLIFVFIAAIGFLLFFITMTFIIFFVLLLNQVDEYIDHMLLSL